MDEWMNETEQNTTEQDDWMDGQTNEQVEDSHFKMNVVSRCTKHS